MEVPKKKAAQGGFSGDPNMATNHNNHMEREKSLELSTSTLARLRSTNWATPAKRVAHYRDIQIPVNHISSDQLLAKTL